MEAWKAWSAGRKGPCAGRVPAAKRERNRLLAAVREHVRRSRPTPPLGVEELLAHTEAALREGGFPETYRDYAAVLVSNEVWKDQVAAYPYERRLLLLPKCLRDERSCRAAVDEYGLVCARCGSCPIGDLEAEARRLGYATMVAEGSPVVLSLIESGKIDAVIGVSCLSVLEKVFPYMEAGAVPGIAIPLLNDGCSLTTADLDWVWDAIHALRGDRARSLDLEALRSEVERWFAPEALEEVLGAPRGAADEVARSWLAKAGKRWRPFLAACTYQAFQQDPAGPLPSALRPIGIAIECFHKASLVHDDIEDGDAIRYGEETVHARHGVPIAVNAGDLLIGEGYRLIAGAGFPPEATLEMLRAAAEAHRTLCVGQGEELAWVRAPRPLSPIEVLEIFREKTAPAFEVALRLGAISAGRARELGDFPRRYSEAVGTAYQVRDDLEDFAGRTGDVFRSRPSLLLALAHERATGESRAFTERIWRQAAAEGDLERRVESLFRDLPAEAAAEELLDAYKFEAIRSLAVLTNPHLKGLLRRVIGKIFDEIEVMECCDDHTAADAADGGRRPEAAA